MIRHIAIFFLYSLVVLLVFGKGIGFSLWADDWNYLWLVNQPFHYPMISWLHPGTMLQFYLLEPVFGTNTVAWQFTGIFLKVFAAYAVMRLAAAVFRSRVTAIVSGLVFAALPMGLEAVNWPSAFIVHVDVICFSSAVASYITARNKGRRIPVSAVVWTVLSVLVDPMRAIALIWIPAIYEKKPIRFVWNRRVAFLLIIIWAGMLYAIVAFWPGYVLWYRHSLLDTSVDFGARTLRLLQFFGVVIGGWMWPHMHEEYDMSRMAGNVTLSLAGIVGMGMFAYVAKRMHDARHTMSRTMVFIGLWIVTTTVFQWLSDPDYIPAVPHRYLVLPGVGVAMIIAIVFERMAWSAKYVLIVVFCFAVWNVSVHTFADMEYYRNALVVEQNMSLIDRTITKRQEHPIIFLNTDKDPLVDRSDYRNHLTYIRWARGDTSLSTFVGTYEELAHYVCGYAYTISDAYAFHVTPDGHMIDDSALVHERLSKDKDVAARCDDSGINMQAEKQ